MNDIKPLTICIFLVGPSVITIFVNHSGYLAALAVDSRSICHLDCFSPTCLHFLGSVVDFTFTQMDTVLFCSFWSPNLQDLSVNGSCLDTYLIRFGHHRSTIPSSSRSSSNSFCPCTVALKAFDPTFVFLSCNLICFETVMLASHMELHLYQG